MGPKRNSSLNIRAPSELDTRIAAFRTIVDALRTPDAPTPDAFALASAGLIASAEEAQREARRCRAALDELLDGLRDGIAETDADGVVRTANQRLASWLQVPPAFLAGRPLLHFVARADCRRFREVTATAASGGDQESAVIRFRPRRGGGVFACEVRARAVGLGHRGAIFWTVRPTEEARPRQSRRKEESPEAASSLEALVNAARQSTLAGAAARRITVTHARPTTLHVHPEHAHALLDALEDLARVALRLANEGATIAVDIQPLDRGEVVVAFGGVSLRLAARGEADPAGVPDAARDRDSDEMSELPRRTG